MNFAENSEAAGSNNTTDGFISDQISRKRVKLRNSFRKQKLTGCVIAKNKFSSLQLIFDHES